VDTPLNKLKIIATSLITRVLVMCFGIALLVFLAPFIFANIVNPPVWFGVLIAIYLLISGILAIIYFFSKKVIHLLIILPAFVYILIGLIVEVGQVR